MINSLIWFHPIEAIALNSTVLPEDVPVIFIIVCDLELIYLSTRSDHWVVAVADIHNQSLLSMSVLPLLFCNFLFFKLAMLQLGLLFVVYYGDVLVLLDIQPWHF
jgi:hypothetical protein